MGFIWMFHIYIYVCIYIGRLRGFHSCCIYGFHMDVHTITIVVAYVSLQMHKPSSENQNKTQSDSKTTYMEKVTCLPDYKSWSNRKPGIHHDTYWQLPWSRPWTSEIWDRKHGLCLQTENFKLVLMHVSKKNYIIADWEV